MMIIVNVLRNANMMLLSPTWKPKWKMRKDFVTATDFWAEIRLSRKTNKFWFKHLIWCERFSKFSKAKTSPPLKKRIKECNTMVFPFSQNFSCFLPYNISDISKKEENHIVKKKCSKKIYIHQL